jgi:hypothetical protein
MAFGAFRLPEEKLGWGCFNPGSTGFRTDARSVEKRPDPVIGGKTGGSEKAAMPGLAVYP